MAKRMEVSMSRGVLTAWLLFLFVVLAGCGQETAPRAPAAGDAPAATFTAHAVTATPTPSPTPTALPAAWATTATPEADNRIARYLFPADIDPETALLIQRAIEARMSHKGDCARCFFAYALLKSPQRDADGTITAYVYVREQAFDVLRGKLREGCKAGLPAVVTLTPAENGWRADVQTPGAGTHWAVDIHALFPEDIWPLAFHPPPALHRALEADVIRQAEAYFGVPYDPKESRLSVQPTPTPDVVIFTPTPTPTVDVFALTPNVSADVNVRKANVTIEVDLYPDVRRAFYKGLLSAGWRVRVFSRQPDPHASARVLEWTNMGEAVGRYEFIARVPLETLWQRLGDRRGFVYHVTDARGQVFWKGTFYVDAGLQFQYQGDVAQPFPQGYPDYLREGVMVGLPNLHSETVAPVFLPAGDTFTVQEPRGGFYDLYFEYNLAVAEGISSSKDLEAMKETLAVAVLPCGEDGVCAASPVLRLPVTVSGGSGSLRASFPHAWLDQRRSRDQFFRLQVVDASGRVYKMAMLHFVPFTP